MEIRVQDALDVACANQIARQTDSSQSFLAMMDRAFLKNYVELDPTQAWALKESARGQAMQPQDKDG